MTKDKNPELLYGFGPEESARHDLNRLIKRTGISEDTYHAELWTRLYEMFKLCNGIDLRGHNMPPLDYAEKEGHIDKLYKLAQEIFPRRATRRSSTRMI